MTYATVEDINARYGDDFLYTIADRDNDDTLDTTAVESALADATGSINSYLSTRYTLPLVETPDLLKRHCASIAVYWLATDNGGASEDQRQQYEDATKWLERIAKGTAELNIGESSEGEETETATGEGASFQSNQRLFSRNSLGAF
ncbi:Mu-like prophage protein [gamma proteobacterium IMCC1989]|nr:Mu-like prophage protein [gamma proteobacterium IMCC1989]